MPEPQDPTTPPNADREETIAAPQSDRENTVLFAGPEPARRFPTMAVAIAAVAIVILVAVLLLLGHRRPAPLPNTLQPLAAYAPSLSLSNIQMSESTSLSGGKSTYIDGTIANHGPSTLTAITVQVLFPDDQALPPQIETVPLNLIRTREPYIDTEPLSAAPLAPGAQADFRLIFESVNDDWNQQQPAIHVIQVSTR